MTRHNGWVVWGTQCGSGRDLSFDDILILPERVYERFISLGDAELMSMADCPDALGFDDDYEFDEALREAFADGLAA